MSTFTESTIEQAALDWLKDLGYTVVYGGEIAYKNMLASLRDSLLPRLMRGEVRVKDNKEI